MIHPFGYLRAFVQLNACHLPLGGLKLPTPLLDDSGQRGWSRGELDSSHCWLPPLTPDNCPRWGAV